MANWWGSNENSERVYLFFFGNHCRGWLEPWNLRFLLLGRKPMTKLDSILKSRHITLSTKICLIKAIAFPVMHGYESWSIKKTLHWRINAFEPWCWRGLLCKEIKPVHPEENQSWILIGRTDAEAKTPKLWPPEVKNWLVEKDPDAKEDWRWEEKGMTENEMIGWHHWLDGHESE